MHRIDTIRLAMHKIIAAMPDGDARNAAFCHAEGVAQCCALLALRRALDQELAAIAGLLHDAYAYRTGVRPLHAANGAEMIRVAFKREWGSLFLNDEQLTICSAIFHHSDKMHAHDAYDELLKDADALARWLADPSDEAAFTRRVFRACEELNLRPPECAPVPEPAPREARFSRAAFADIAQALAARPVRGARDDPAFAAIIRHFPEHTAFDELTFAWCAAFVYHCALAAGLMLPIRHAPAADTRFACVAAWLEWGRSLGFCFEEGERLPARGDILIYHQIIPPERKPPSSAPWDHIGVVLDARPDALLVAEGNAGNLNASRIVRRPRGARLGRFLRIPEDWQYDGWKYDYKTGAPRAVEVDA